MTQVQLRCKEDNTIMFQSKTHDGHFIYSCPKCDKKKVTYGLMQIKI